MSKFRDRHHMHSGNGKQISDFQSKSFCRCAMIEKIRRRRGSPHLPPSSPPTCYLPSIAIVATLSLGHLCCWPAPPLLSHLPPLLLPPASAASAVTSSHRPLLSFPTQAVATSAVG
ncbi:hypothetical protein BHE74_00031018 [Ensete ventricosum]|nr:hypothetical protein BHE74_00031018 [Ensete ventricosum]